MDEINEARMVPLREGHMKLTMELEKTQEAVNRAMQRVDDHSEMLQSHDKTIRRLHGFSKLANDKLDAFVHPVDGQFSLHLHFIPQDDIPKVIGFVMQTTRVYPDKDNRSITLLDLVPRLLIRQ